ncbi:MAG: TVP38/TMEM64 family protein [Pseudomonadota bacterium]
MIARLKRFLPLILIIAAMAIAFQLGLHRYLSIESIVEHRESLQGFVDANLVPALLVFIGVYAGAVALSLPGAVILTIAGGLLFGWLIGGFATVFAATIGATLIFLAAKTSFGDTLRAKAGPFLDKLASGFESDAFNYLLFLRLVPAFPFWLVNLAPAFLGVPLRTYMIATFIGIIPGTFAFSFIGSGLDSVIAAQKTAYEECVSAGNTGCSVSLDPGSLITPEILMAFAALGVAALIPVAIKRFRKASA